MSEVIDLGVFKDVSLTEARFLNLDIRRNIGEGTMITFSGVFIVVRLCL